MPKIEKLTSLPIEEKIGQLFFIGLGGPEIDDQTAALLKDIAPGGVCLFARNVRTRQQVRRFLDGIRENLRIEPFLSLDQEGGLVDRLRRISTPMPSARAVKTAEDARKLASLTAEIVLRLGFNMNFAPVVDVLDEQREQFSNGLHSRTFGRSKEEVTELAGVYLETMQEAGCIGCLKHFPGLGAAETDAHDELPQINLRHRDLTENDLVPYTELFRRTNVHAVMIAHAAFPNLDLQETDKNGKLLPASLSFNFISKLLREELGFDNLAITDDLEMGAVINNYGIGEACRLAVRAGNDLLAICAGADSVRTGYEAVLAAVRSGEISEDRINRSLERIARVKSVLSTPIPFDESRLETLSAEVADLNKKVLYSYGG